MSVLSDRSTKQALLAGGVIATFVVAGIAFSRRRRRPTVSYEGELESWAATPNCAEIIRYDGWGTERREVVKDLVRQEISAARAEGRLISPRNVANQFIKMVDPNCPASPSTTSPAHSYWLDTAELARDYILADNSITPRVVEPIGTEFF